MRWRVPEPGAVDTALRDAGLQRDDGATVWRVLRASPDAPGTVIATIELSGDELVGEVNSHERAETLRKLIATALPDAELDDDSVSSVDAALADHEPGDRPAQPAADDPAVREMLAAFIADQERRWLDESIPALGGRTPRDAATDPIGREQLSQLLDSFPAPDDADVGAMNSERLRSALGL